VTLSEKVKEVVILNEMIIDDYGSYEEAMQDGQIAYFDFKGQNIINPFFDETGANSVDPVEYYGHDNIERFISVINWDNFQE